MQHACGVPATLRESCHTEALHAGRRRGSDSKRPGPSPAVGIRLNELVDVSSRCRPQHTLSALGRARPASGGREAPRLLSDTPSRQLWCGAARGLNLSAVSALWPQPRLPEEVDFGVSIVVGSQSSSPPPPPLLQHIAFPYVHEA
eukprot:364341-Chlamydomonas_euryale.AAC.16